MNPMRVIGVLLGLLTLAATFFLPFSDLVNGSAGFQTLYQAFSFLLHNFATLASSGNSGITLLTFVYLVAFVLVVLAGIVGFMPLGAGALGAIGMAAITVAPYFAFTDYAFSMSEYGSGFALIWGASIGCLVVSAANWRRGRSARAAQPA